MSEEPPKPVLEYGQPEREAKSVGRVLAEVFRGIGGYLFLTFLCAIVFQGMGAQWVTIPASVLVPLVVMLLLAKKEKSRPMMLAVWITFGVAALSCGTCFAISMM